MFQQLDATAQVLFEVVVSVVRVFVIGGFVLVFALISGLIVTELINPQTFSDYRH
ncbi:MAG: hypothetical protein NT141_03760 [candidate division WWE3 bacterium]|nr:hypothetical protein [candidate division WWE3 bacterium]